MKNEATKNQDTQLVLFTGGEAVEDLIYEFLKDRSPLTERAYQQDLKAFFEFYYAGKSSKRILLNFARGQIELFLRKRRLFRIAK